MGDRAQGSLALWTQELFCRPYWSVTVNLDSISARGDFVCMGRLGVCVLAGTGRKMAADRWGYAAPHWWGMEGKEAVVFGDLRRKLKTKIKGWRSDEQRIIRARKAELTVESSECVFFFLWLVASFYFRCD
jgi:hypothetical protein